MDCAVVIWKSNPACRFLVRSCRWRFAPQESEFIVQGKLDAAGGGRGDWQAEAGPGWDARPGGRVEKSDIAMVEEIEGLGNDIQVAGTKGNHFPGSLKETSS